jgi:uncharacterized protein YlxW (UPF0749 family)
LYYTNKHIKLNAAKDAEIAEALKEIKTRYNNLHADVRAYNKRAENEKARETIITRNNHEDKREEGEREEAGRTGQSQ